MQADFELIADEHNVTALIRDRLLELRITDKAGLESDELEIRLDDRDGHVEFPPKGAHLQVSLGWNGQPLSPMGRFTVDEIELSGPPATLTIRAKPADMRQEARSTRSIAYESTTLADIVAAVAGRNSWEPACRVEVEVPRADQQRESDLHFITRLARQHGATATVKEGKLLVVPRDGGKTASGKSLPVVTLTPRDLTDYRLTFPDRASFAKVKAAAHDTKTGQQVVIELPNPDSTAAQTGGEHVDRHTYPTPEAAKAAAQSRLDGLNRATASGSLSSIGRVDIAAETTVRLSGFKAGADGDYLVESVTRSYSGRGWVDSYEISAGNQGKAKVGKSKKKDGPLKVLELPPA
ncbi:phage late control D family protein [Azotobacter chroococcum]|uniref:phage late control D family protein n=1 Tax=Azotobacter chroococcum TaxID=353 RepID=UPI0010AE2BFC|nr:contractile injection system protein, VgrG/Pvc8 family [Azotobacter chroococcum]TKD40696.1 late control protein [Azotobacter chroococcum]